MKIGIFADPHYSTCEIAVKTRRPSLSDRKIREIFGIFAKNGVRCVVCLGDVINTENNREKDMKNLLYISDILKSGGFVFHCLIGNHDIEAFTKDEFYALTGFAPLPYYTDVGKVRLLFLDADYFSDGENYSPEKVDWKDSFIPEAELDFIKKAATGAEKMIVFTHQNLDDRDNCHCVRNASRVREVIESCGNVKTVYSGHYHKGYKENINGIDYITPVALCEGEGIDYLIIEI